MEIFISSITQIGFTYGVINDRNRPLFPTDAVNMESLLIIDARDPDDEVSLAIRLIPMDDNGDEMPAEFHRLFSLGKYSRDEVREKFIKAVACL